METTVFCTFEQKLTVNDVGRLTKIIGAVIPIPHQTHLISHTQIGLHAVFEQQKEYARVRSLLRNMNTTVLRRVEGNQLLLGVPVQGQSYTIRNTGPVPWEKGDMLVLIPPLTLGDKDGVVSLHNWNLVLPWIVPQQLAAEINQRIIIIALMSLDRRYDEVQAAVTHLRRIQHRGVTFTLPDITTEANIMLDLKNVCVSMSMLSNLSTELTLTYIRKLAMEDHSMLLVKCQEILGRRLDGQAPARPGNFSPEEEMARLSAFFVMVRQLTDIVNEQPTFLVCDVSPDNKSATCLFKG